MIFHEVIGIQNRPAETNMIHREAVRAVIMKDKKILMVHNKKGDYKFPGGGVEKGEDGEDALIREILEETGYHVDRIEGKIGMIVERREDAIQENTVFEMNSNYYLCTIHEEQCDQKLDDYEAELEFCPVWIEIEEAIKRNERLVIENQDIHPWVIRELFVLKRIREHQDIKENQNGQTRRMCPEFQ